MIILWDKVKNKYMPIIKSAIKKVRKDKKRTARNKVRENVLKSLIKKARSEKTPKALTAVFSALDKAVKVNLIHKNKANRLKSRLSLAQLKTNTPDKSKAKTKKITLKRKAARKK